MILLRTHHIILYNYKLIHFATVGHRHTYTGVYAFSCKNTGIQMVLIGAEILCTYTAFVKQGDAGTNTAQVCVFLVS